MKIALDPHMHRHLNLRDLCRKAAELGYEHIELSPRDDFLLLVGAPAGTQGTHCGIQGGPEGSRRPARLDPADVSLGEPA
ncbi:hypothetical protein LZK76_07810 [Rhizobium leguminosarum]|nr:hypothetical protein LZK76_07810 [Rhizobium leguminosarum]